MYSLRHSQLIGFIKTQGHRGIQRHTEAYKTVFKHLMVAKEHIPSYQEHKWVPSQESLYKILWKLQGLWTHKIQQWVLKHSMTAHTAFTILAGPHTSLYRSSRNINVYRENIQKLHYSTYSPADKYLKVPTGPYGIPDLSKPIGESSCPAHNRQHTLF